MTGIGIVLLLAALGVIALTLVRALRAARPPRRRPRRRSAPPAPPERPVPPAEAERRALALLRSVVNHEEWAMFRDLGFICVAGNRPASRRGPGDGPRHRYLIYPHLPVVALLPRSLAPVREYCIQFPEVGGERSRALPAGDDVLAKWMTLRADEDRLLAYANVANAGCQVSLGRIERDLGRLERWQRQRPREAATIQP